MQGCELDRFLTEFEFKRYLQVRVQVRVLRIIFLEFEFGKNDRVQRVRSPGLNKLQWHEQLNACSIFSFGKIITFIYTDCNYLNNKLYFVVIFYFLFDYLNIFLMNSNSFIRV